MNICLQPKFIERLGHEVQCGRCRACRLSRKYEWVTRLTHEAHSWRWSVLYVTLTYSPEYLPRGYTLVPKDLQDFYKRLRKRLGPNGLRIKYYSCGEYGDSYGRPHYHALIYGLNMSHADLIFKAWGKCEPQSFKCEVPTSKDALGYVAGYTRKKIRKRYNSWYRETHGREPEFARQSIGIGKSWALAHADQYKAQLSYYQDGKERFLPRYYRKVLGIDAEMLQPQIDKMLCKNDEMYHESYLRTGKRLTYTQFMQSVREECDLRLKLKEEAYDLKRKQKGIH